MPGAASGPHSRARPVCSQGQLGPAFALHTPIAHLLLASPCSQPRSLPFSEMPVLDGKLRQFGGDPILGSRIERLKFFPEQPLRPSIRDEVMKIDHQLMVILFE